MPFLHVRACRAVPCPGGARRGKELRARTYPVGVRKRSVESKQLPCVPLLAPSGHGKYVQVVAPQGHGKQNKVSTCTPARAGQLFLHCFAFNATLAYPLLSPPYFAVPCPGGASRGKQNKAR